MAAIARVHARQIFDSRGNPTVEVDVTLAGGAFGRAAVPSGASTGTHEAVELRDGGSAYGGKGVSRAVANVNGEIARAVTGREAADQQGLDRALIELDGSADKGRLGANAILGVSLAAARAQSVRRQHAAVALARRRGGDAAAGADDERPQRWRSRRQPGRFPGVHARPGRRDIAQQAVRMGAETYHELERTLKARGLASGVGDEGGFAPALDSNAAPLELITAAIEAAGYTPGEDVAIALDPAASEFYREGGTGSRVRAAR